MRISCQLWLWLDLFTRKALDPVADMAYSIELCYGHVPRVCVWLIPSISKKWLILELKMPKNIHCHYVEASFLGWEWAWNARQRDAPTFVNDRLVRFNPADASLSTMNSNAFLHLLPVYISSLKNCNVFNTILHGDMWNVRCHVYGEISLEFLWGVVVWLVQRCLLLNEKYIPGVSAQLICTQIECPLTCVSV